MKLNEEFLLKMREATQLLQTSGPAAATAAIQRMLQGKDDDVSDSRNFSDGFIDINPVPDKTREASDGAAASHGFQDRLRSLRGAGWAKQPATQPIQEAGLDTEPHPVTAGKFLSASCTNRAGTRAYKLYVPSAYKGEPLPLIVMLHGCKQNPDDFAAGTGMNRVAERNNCFVAYPAQTQNANGSNCWNWFKTSDQQRDRGEPSILADITLQVMRDYCIDPKRVYVAGLSAGGAMATILAATYPELYAAVGIHSGLPIGSAHDVASAFGAMKDGGNAKRLRSHSKPVPAIVFHGDRDSTVHPNNGAGALKQCMSAGANAHETRVEKGQVQHGRSYTREIYYADDGISVAEHWTIHGAGHAWSGGSRAGSYTDIKGPDASQEMMRFFYAHTKG